ncbi:MAG: hypothetical protein IID46_01475 [Planctomycetes bacterium]|nr:hypothetical protein [Planctomycetota bacterium]
MELLLLQSIEAAGSYPGLFTRLCLETRFKKPGFFRKPGFCDLQSSNLEFSDKAYPYRISKIDAKRQGQKNVKFCSWTESFTSPSGLNSTESLPQWQ